MLMLVIQNQAELQMLYNCKDELPPLLCKQIEHWAISCALPAVIRFDTVNDVAERQTSQYLEATEFTNATGYMKDRYHDEKMYNLAAIMHCTGNYSLGESIKRMSYESAYDDRNPSADHVS